MSKLWVSFEIKILNYELNYEIVKLWRIQRNYDLWNKKSQWWVNTEHKNATFKNDEIHSRNHVKKIMTKVKIMRKFGFWHLILLHKLEFLCQF